MTYINIFKSKISTNDLIKKTFYKSLGVKIFDDNIIRNSYGKIFLNNGYHISISRSDSLSVCAISNNNIGIDIEKIRQYDFKNIIKRMHLSVIEFLNSNPSLEKNYFIWTNVEAYLKFIGTGIIHLEDMKIEKSKLSSFAYIFESYILTFYQENKENTIPCITVYNDEIEYHSIRKIEYPNIREINAKRN
jgi:phosphopantetheinyl transferase